MESNNIYSKDAKWRGDYSGLELKGTEQVDAGEWVQIFSSPGGVSSRNVTITFLKTANRVNVHFYYKNDA